jgi:hypothetical protein
LGQTPLRGLDEPVGLVQLTPTGLVGRRYLDLRLDVERDASPMALDDHGDATESEVETTLSIDVPPQNGGPLSPDTQHLFVEEIMSPTGRPTTSAETSATDAAVSNVASPVTVVTGASSAGATAGAAPAVAARLKRQLSQHSTTSNNMKVDQLLRNVALLASVVAPALLTLISPAPVEKQEAFIADMCRAWRVQVPLPGAAGGGSSAQSDTRSMGGDAASMAGGATKVSLFAERITALAQRVAAVMRNQAVAQARKAQ